MDLRKQLPVYIVANTKGWIARLLTPILENFNFPCQTKEGES